MAELPKKAPLGVWIPETVMSDENLSPAEVLLYGRISGLCFKEGYCWAGNAYLAKHCKVKPRTIQIQIKHLISAGHLYFRMTRKNTRRCLSLPECDTEGGTQKTVGGGTQKTVPHYSIKNSIKEKKESECGCRHPRTLPQGRGTNKQKRPKGFGLVEHSAPTTGVDGDMVVEAWNQMAGGKSLARWTKITPARKRRLDLRLHEQPTVAWWKELFFRIEKVPSFSEQGWLTLDFLIANDTNAVKLFEEAEVKQASEGKSQDNSGFNNGTAIKLGRASKKRA